MRIVPFAVASIILHALAFMLAPWSAIVANGPCVHVREGASALTVSFVRPVSIAIRPEERTEATDRPIRSSDAEAQTAEPAAQAEHAASAPGGDDGAQSQAAVQGQSQPRYSWLSRVRGEQGVVLVLVSVSAQGTCTQARVISSSGYDRLDEAAVSWARTAVYSPACKEGSPIASELRLRVPFELRPRTQP